MKPLILYWGSVFLYLFGGKEAVIARVYKMLKPGGIFVTNTACLKDMMWLFELML